MAKSDDSNPFVNPKGHFQQEETPEPRTKHAAEICRISEPKCADPRSLPPTSDDPFAAYGLADWRPYACIIEPVDGGADWRYQAVGERLVDFFKIDASGRLMSDIMDPQPHKDGVALLNSVVTPPFRPHYFRLGYSSDTMADAVTDNVFIPVPAADGRGMRVLGFTFFDD